MIAMIENIIPVPRSLTIKPKTLIASNPSRTAAIDAFTMNSVKLILEKTVLLKKLEIRVAEYKTRNHGGDGYVDDIVADLSVELWRRVIRG